MAILGDLLRKLGLVAPGEPQEPEDIGVNEIGAEETVIEDWKVIANKEYPDAYDYDGPAYYESIKFKGIRVIDVKPDWLMETVVWGSCKKADAVPLKAILKERKIKTPYFPDIFSEYELTYHYHDSPIVMTVGVLVIGTLVAAGFLILAKKVPKAEDWKAITTEVKETVSGISSTIKWGIVGVGGIYLLSKFR